jgi:hypothetical protein
MSSRFLSVKRWLVGVAAAVALVGAIGGTALAAPGDGKTADTAMPVAVSATAAPVSGELAGNSGGVFEYYAYSYPGQNALQTLTISINSGDFDVANAVGISLWDSMGNEIGNLNALGAQPGTNSLTFSTETEGQMLVQVWSYSDTPVSYTVMVAPAVAPDYGDDSGD